MTSPQYQRGPSIEPEVDRQAGRAPDDGYADDRSARRAGPDRAHRPGQALRLFQVLAGLAGAILFGMGIAAIFRVEFAAGFFETSGDVAGFGFSPALAVAAIILGGAIMATAFAGQDRSSTAVVGLVTLIVGIVALVLGAERTADVTVDRDSALLFVVLGAVAFVLALVPWWRRRSGVVRTEVR